MKVFVACSASNNIKDEYFSSSRILLEDVLKDNDLVFGACKSGLMEVAYDVTKKNGNKVIGVCPLRYKHDFKTLDCDKEIITNTILERINGLIFESDILLFLPGGIGTINELLQSIESKRCHEFDKPIIIYNLNGFYNKLFDFLDKIYEEKFARDIDKELYFVSDSNKEILNYIKTYKIK